MSSNDGRTVIEAAQSLDVAAGLALRLAAVAGLRRSDLAALQWTDFDLETGQLTVDADTMFEPSPAVSATRTLQ